MVAIHVAAAWLAVAAAAVAAAEPAGRRSVLVLNRSVELRDLGLTVTIMPDAIEQPLPPPTAYTYVRTERGASEKVDLYDPFEFWLRSQHAAAWRTPAGAVLRIATVSSLPPPVPRERPHADMKAIEDALRRAQQEGEPSGEGALSTWAAAFTGIEGASVREVEKRPPRLSELWEVSAPAAPRLCGFLFRLNRRYIGLTRAPDRLYAVFAVAPEGATAAGVRGSLTGRFLETVGPTAGRAVARTDTRDPATARMDTDRNPVAGMEESRRQAADSIRNMRGWAYVSTDHFVILTNLDARRRGLIRDLQARLEALRGVFERLIPPDPPIEDVGVVRVFATSAEYEAYVPAEQGWTGGLWIPSRQELVVRPADDDTRAELRDRILAAASHESFHQYVHYALDRALTPPWFNEGHAELLEPAVIDRAGRVDIPEKQEYVEVLQAVCGRDGAGLNLAGFIQMSYDQFYGGDPRQRPARYAMAWGLVYYLRKAAPAARADGYDRIIPACLAAIREGQSPPAATARAFAGVDMARLQADFADFWSSTRRRRDVQRTDIVEAAGR